MQFSTLLAGLFFAIITTSTAWTTGRSLEPWQGGNTVNSTNRDVDINKTCRRLRTLKSLNNIAKNDTAPDATSIHGRLAQARIDWIKSNSADITAKLDKLASNSTLVAECDTIDAQRDAVHECKALDTLERLVTVTNSQTGLGQGPVADFLNDEQKQSLQQKFEKASLKLQELKSNATLMGLCNSNTVLQQNGAIGSRESPPQPAHAICFDI
ncbi:hypothetical protein G6011_09249 [Alternaria panax]|uniref:Uncharacterized protein n=1 Tax=Alternaria panax TaxID=48097 RepID=A0AAD4IAS9_9PLEO|nr:hypothetical protein G6011_09249 [Alternaria panax]